MQEGAAFGFFPQLKPRRLLQDQAGSADLPLQILRGRLAGLLGLPSDIGNLVRTPQPMEMFGSYDYEQPKQLPYTTEQFLKELPLAPTSTVGKLGGTVASFVPLNPAPVVRGVQKIGSMAGREMSDRILSGRPMLSGLLAEPPVAKFAVEPNIPKMSLLETAEPQAISSLLDVKPQAPVSDLGFYSAVEKAALNLSRNKGTGQSFINDLLKGQDVKKYELEAMGLDEFLANKPNVTKQDVQDYIANNRIDVKQVTLGGKQDFDTNRLTQLESEYKALKNHPIDDPSFGETKYDEMIRLMNIRDQSTTNSLYGMAESATRAAQRAQSQGMNKTAEKYFRDAELYNIRAEKLDLEGQGISNPPKYDKYQLPKGENYREILLTLPEKTRPVSLSEVNAERAKISPLLEPIDQAQYDDLVRSGEVGKVSLGGEQYRSSHFDEPNILAHMRVNDRIDADGKKMLFIEEIQSDWHQAGREKGYKTKQSLEKWYAQNKFAEDPPFAELNKEQLKVIEQNRNAGMGGDNAVPDAPFKDTWYQLALKRAINEAVEKGYDRIGLTTGAEQAKRYDLSKQVDEIAVPMVNADGTRSVRIDPTQGTSIKLMLDDKGIVTGYGAGSTQFSGKRIDEVVGKELAEKIMSSKEPTNFSGVDLSVGGEGMKKYYDEIYPNYLDKYGKKFGSRVGETRIKTGRGVEGGEPVRYLDITPEMRESVKKGQPIAFLDQPLMTGLLA